MKTSWQSLIKKKMRSNKDQWSDIVYCTLDTDQLTKKFDNDYGIAEGVPFLMWTKTRVYQRCTRG